MMQKQAGKDDDDSVTIGFGGSSGKSEVVGWVVCIEGSDKGTGFPLKTGRNFIGRNANQDIVLARIEQYQEISMR